MRVLVLLILGAAVQAAPDADGYFELGLEYLKKGFFVRAREAFAESLLLAPGQPVPTAFLGVACAAEGRNPAEAAELLRGAYGALPKNTDLRADLRELLPSPKALAFLVKEYRRHLKRASTKERRRDVLTVLAFLEVHDGDAIDARGLDLLLKDDPKDAYAVALARLRPKKKADPGIAPAG